MRILYLACLFVTSLIPAPNASIFPAPPTTNRVAQTMMAGPASTKSSLETPLRQASSWLWTRLLNPQNLMFLSGLLITLTTLPMAKYVTDGGTRRSGLLARKLYLMGLYLLFAGLWGVGSMFISMATNAESALAIWKLAYTGVILIPVLYLHAVVLMGLPGSKSKWTEPLLLLAYTQAAISITGTWAGRMFLGVSRLDNGIYWPIGGTAFAMSFAFWLGVAALANLLAYKLVREATKECRVRFLMLFLGVIAYIGGVTNFLPIIPELRSHLSFVVPYGNFWIPFGALLQSYGIYLHGLVGRNTKLVRRGFRSAVKFTLFSLAYYPAHFYLESFLRTYGMDDKGFAGLLVAVLTFALVDPLWRAISSFAALEKRRERKKDSTTTATRAAETQAQKLPSVGTQKSEPLPEPILGNHLRSGVAKAVEGRPQVVTTV